MGGRKESPSAQFIAGGKAEAGDMWESLTLLVLGNPFIISSYLLFYVFAAQAMTT